MPQKNARRSQERRGRPRADAQLSMRLEGAPAEGSPAQIVTESQNISSSGVYCTSSHFMAPLSKVALTIVLPRIPGTDGRQELIKCEGIVVRCQPVAKRGESRFELACMFSSLDEKRRALLDDFVTWRNLASLRAATANGRPARTRAAARPAARPATAPRATPARKTATRKAARRRTAH
jgi:hypothetical protein